MEHVSLYRRFRPSTFDKVIGQKHIVRTLTNQIKNNRIGHAYLFTGTRGTGKTSCAKIFARAVNCLNPVDGSPCGECEVCKALSGNGNIDILEMDAASNNGVDEIRDLKENVQYRPTIGRYKVYIIDEVHMLTASAFNALLKTLEEPPEHVIFILATTEVQKLPQTILSRCMRFDFRLVGKEDLIALLERIFKELNVEYDPRALSLIAAGGEGCVRDTLSLADMCLSYGGDKITYEDAAEITCATNMESLNDLALAILDGRTGEALRLVDSLLSVGRNTVSRDLAAYFTDMLNLKNVPNVLPDGMTDEEAALIKARLNDFTNYRIARVMDIMCALEGELRYASQPKVIIEAAIVRACELTTEVNVEGLTNRIKELEKKLNDIVANGVTVAPTSVRLTETSEKNAIASVSQSTAPVQPTVASASTSPNPTTTASVEQSTPKTQDAEKKKSVDVNDLLKGLADAQVVVVFEDRREVSDVDVYRAGEIWGRVLLRLADSHEMMLKMAASCIESGYKIIGDKFVLETDDNATVSLFNRREYHDKLQELIREESGVDYVFTCVKRDDNKTNVNPQDKITLDKLFSGEVKLKLK